MPSVVIFGGNGKVARYLTTILTAEAPAYEVHSIIRNPDQISELTALGAKPIVQSIEEASVSSIVTTLTAIKPDVAIWAASAEGDESIRNTAVNRDGAIKAMDACHLASVKRFITLSAMLVRDHSKPWPEWYNEGTIERATKVVGFIRPWLDAKYAADRELVEGNGRRGLEFTIVRAAGVGVQPGVGTVAAGKVQLEKVVKREDLAHVVVQCIKQPGTIGLVFDVSAGDTPIAEEITRVAEEKINLFDF